MAKSPAINWYFDNWQGGTLGLNRHQKGCYIDLLNAQFQLGHLSLDQIKNILGADFSQWNAIRGKFTEDEQGLFFNERLAAEILKREKFIEQQQQKSKKGVLAKNNPVINPRVNPKASHGLTPGEPFYETEIELSIKGGTGENLLIPKMLKRYMDDFKSYPPEQSKDFPALLEIAYKIADKKNIPRPEIFNNQDVILNSWGKICEFIGQAEKWWKGRCIADLNNEWQRLVMQMAETETPVTPVKRMVV